MSKVKMLSWIFFLLSIAINSKGQEINRAKNTIYYELGGTGYGVFSLNYERLITINQTVSFAPGLGVSISKVIHVSNSYNFGDYQFFIPLQANFIFGRNKHHFETGIGMPVAIRNDNYGESKYGLIGGIYVLRFGYRYQPKDSGLLLRASVNPTWMGLVPTIMAGLSIGYDF